jgi:hypothetical protein
VSQRSTPSLIATSNSVEPAVPKGLEYSVCRGDFGSMRSKISFNVSKPHRFCTPVGKGSEMAVHRDQRAVGESLGVEELRLVTGLKVRVHRYVSVEIYAEI